jgi:hypothetical protein
MEAIFALFDDYEQAVAAVQLLVENRFRPEAMNVIVSDSVVRNRLRGKLDRRNVLASELGAGLDRLVAGEQPVNVPEVGSIYAAGAEATTLAKAASLATALANFGLPGRVIEESIGSIRGGGVLLWVKTDEARIPEAANILRIHKARHVGHYAADRLSV